MKGSSVDRSILLPEDRDRIKRGHHEEIIEKYKKSILKDMDFKDFHLKFKLSKKDSNLLSTYVASDAELLKGYQLTDYSLLVTIHRYNKEYFEKCFKNPRIMKSSDNKYIYCFSIIDFLAV
jgi:hypothetical protein